MKNKHYKKYTDNELRQFDQELNAYKVIGPITGEKVLLYKGWERYMVDQGAVKPLEGDRYAVYVEEEINPGTDVRTVNSTLYDSLVDKFNQWADWQGRMKYAEQKRLETYEQ